MGIKTILTMSFAALFIAAAVPQVTGIWPTSSKTVNSGGKFWDSAYATSQSRQHLGVDLKATVKDKVLSPVDGYVITNQTNLSQGKAYIVIKDKKTGWEHVLGHISSSLPECNVSKFPDKCPKNTYVTQGQFVGNPKPKDEFGVHVHWGINKKSVSSASRYFTGTEWKRASGKQWGWGRAPVEAELQMACSLGWINPINYNKCEK